jgi:hypothetical protein
VILLIGHLLVILAIVVILRRVPVILRRVSVILCRRGRFGRRGVVPPLKSIDELVFLAVIAQAAARARLAKLGDAVALHLVGLEGWNIVKYFLLGVDRLGLGLGLGLRFGGLHDRRDWRR